MRQVPQGRLSLTQDFSRPFGTESTILSCSPMLKHWAILKNPFGIKNRAPQRFASATAALHLLP